MIYYKIDVIEELSKKGYNPARIRKERWISEATMTKIRRKENITLSTLNILCVMLRCQPGDIIEVIPSDSEKIEYF